MNVGALMLLIAGAALGLWLALPELKEMLPPNSPAAGDLAYGRWDQPVLLLLVFVIGGMSLVGVPLLLWTARHQVWHAGRMLWFIQGTATWLLWPPMIYRRTVEGSLKGITTCYYYGTPPMALYVTIGLLAGGYLNRSRRRRIRLSWQERVGLVLGLVWACTGLYMISLYYRNDFLRK